MSKRLEEVLGLPSMSESIESYDEDDYPVLADYSQMPDTVDVDAEIAALGGADHARKMDELYLKFKDQGDLIFDLASDIEVTKAARMFEVANAVMKNAMDAQNSKRDSQLKTMKFKLEQMKLALDQRNSGVAPAETVAASATVFMDRNEMLRQLRAQNDEDASKDK